jgi:hypothetical protein
MGIAAYYWSSEGPERPGLQLERYDESNVVHLNYGLCGASVRCIKGEAPTNPGIFVYDYKGNLKKLTVNEESSVRRVIGAFKLKNRTLIADLVSYPFSYSFFTRDYTQDSVFLVKTKDEFLNGFNDILDDGAIRRVADEDIHEWKYDPINGGISIGYGYDNFYVGRNGKISAINMGTEKGAALRMKNQISSDSSSVR